MNTATLTFNISGGSTASVSQTAVETALTGTTNLTLAVSGDGTIANNTKKLIMHVSDGSAFVLNAPLTGSSSVIGQKLTHVLLSQLSGSATYTIAVTGIRQNLVIDYYTIYLTVNQATLSGYGYVSLLQTAVFDTSASSSGLLLTAELNQQNQRNGRRDIVNFVVPASIIAGNIVNTFPTTSSSAVTSVSSGTVSGSQLPFGFFSFGNTGGVTRFFYLNNTTDFGIDFETNTEATDLYAPNLSSIDPANLGSGFVFIDSNTTLKTISMSALSTCNVNLQISNNAALTAIDLSMLRSDPGGIVIKTNAALATFSLPSWLPTNGTTNDFTANALNATSVNSLLARGVANAAFVTGSLLLSAGANAAPTGQGITDKATLIGRGVTVTTN